MFDSLVKHWRNYSNTKLLDEMWYLCMERGAPYLNDIETFLIDKWLTGDLDQAFINHWIETIQKCPDRHGSRIWCAYCGDLPVGFCDDCGDMYEGPSREYTFLCNTGICRSCFKYAATCARCELTYEDMLDGSYCDQCKYELENPTEDRVEKMWTEEDGTIWEDNLWP